MERARRIPQVGDILNQRYRLNAELGRGAFAIAFAGMDMQKHQAVAVKVLHTLNSDEDINLFSEEAYLMVDLEHPNIVPFLDYVSMKEGIHPYIVMKLAAKGSLQGEINKRQISGDWVPVRRSVLLLDQAGEGLGYLHGKRIVHRDLKPDNLLLAGEEELWVSDFNIAKKLFGEDPLKTGHFDDTVLYSAPEQIRGKPEEASDQYDLAITAYYLITGRKPFTGNSDVVKDKHLHETPLSLAEAVQRLNRQDINSKVIMALDPIIMRALAKDPDKRHGSITLFTKTLVQEYDSASGEKPERTVFQAVKALRERRQAEQAATVILDEDRKKKEANALLQKALAFLNKERYSKALVAFEQVIQLDPTNNFAEYDKGIALNALGRHEEAVTAYEQAIITNLLEDSEAFNNKGNTLSVLGRHEEALAAYDEAIRINPQDRSAFNNKGTALEALGRREEALAAYDQAICLDPIYSLAYYNKGTALEALGRHEEALAAYDEAISFNPQYSKAYNGKGNALEALGRHEEALAVYDEAISINPRYSKAYNGKGSALRALERNKEAVAAYNRAIRLDPNFSLAYYNKGITLEALGRHEKALAAYKKAEELDPSDRDAKSKREELEEIIKRKNRQGFFKRLLGR